VIFDGSDKLKIRIRTALPTQCDPEATIKELIFTLVSFFSENQFFFRMMNIEDSKEGDRGSPNRKRWEQERSQLIDAIVQMLLQAGDAGVIHARHPRTEAQLLMGMVRSVLRHNIEKLTADQMATEITRIYLYGMRSDGREASTGLSTKTPAGKEAYVRSV